MTKRLLVTGAAGYIGSVLCERLLAHGYGVVALDNLMYSQDSLLHLCSSSRFEFVRGDVRDEGTLKDLLETVDAVLPLAAVVGAPACDRDPETARSVNLEAVRLLNRLRRPDQLVVFPTTNSGYGTRSTDALACDETAPLAPISLYGRTKVEAEAELLTTPNVITLRLATAFGTSPRMRIDLLVNHFVHQAFTEGYLVLFEKEFKRNFIHVRDVADCFVHCLENASTMTGRAYNVGLDTANISKEELAAKIKEHLPFLDVHTSDVGHDPDQRNYIVSSERLRQTGFEARRSVDDGIQELIKGFRMRPCSWWRNA